MTVLASLLLLAALVVFLVRVGFVVAGLLVTSFFAIMAGMLVLVVRALFLLVPVLLLLVTLISLLAVLQLRRMLKRSL